MLPSYQSSQLEPFSLSSHLALSSFLGSFGSHSHWAFALLITSPLMKLTSLPSLYNQFLVLLNFQSSSMFLFILGGTNHINQIPSILLSFYLISIFGFICFLLPLPVVLTTYSWLSTPVSLQEDLGGHMGCQVTNLCIYMQGRWFIYCFITLAPKL